MNATDRLEHFKKGGGIKIKHPGRFTAKAKAAGESVQEYGDRRATCAGSARQEKQDLRVNARKFKH